MENDQLLDANYSTSFGITSDIRAFLSETARWANFLAIIGFVIIGIIVVIAIFAGSMIGTMASQIPNSGFNALSGGVITILYLAMAGIYIFPVLYLYRFATNMKIALRNDNQEALSASFENLKSHYKFFGILMIIVLGFYALMLVLTIIGGLAFL